MVLDADGSKVGNLDAEYVRRVARIAKICHGLQLSICGATIGRGHAVTPAPVGVLLNLEQRAEDAAYPLRHGVPVGGIHLVDDFEHPLQQATITRPLMQERLQQTKVVLLVVAQVVLPARLDVCETQGCAGYKGNEIDASAVGGSCAGSVEGDEARENRPTGVGDCHFAAVVAGVVHRREQHVRKMQLQQQMVIYKLIYEPECFSESTVVRGGANRRIQRRSTPPVRRKKRCGSL